MSRREERQAQGADENSLSYGSIGSFSRKVSEALKKKGLNMKAKDWGHQNKLPRRKP